MVTPEEARKLANEVRETMPSDVMRLWAADAANGLRELAAQIEALQADAERYRWLRDEAHPDREDTGISVSEQDWNDWGKSFHRFYSGKELDAKIDAAMKDNP